MFDRSSIAKEQDKDFLTRAVSRAAQAMGPAIEEAMADPAITEIMLNGDGRLYVEKLTAGMQECGTIDKVSAFTIVKTLASLSGVSLNAQHPILSGEIPYNGSRIEIQIPPVVKAPCFTIRKHTALSLSLSELITNGMLTVRQGQILISALLARQSIVVSGGTGCGKTTLVNALLAELTRLCPQERIVNVEDTAELKVTSANRLNLLTAPGLGMDVLLRSALRSRPDRIVVGEVRGAEALDLIDAFSTGHRGGLTTVHAGSIAQALKRLVLLVSRNQAAPRLIEPTIAQALDLIVQLDKRPQRHVVAIAKLEDYVAGEFVWQSLDEGA
ncbi:MAG: P-type conjugative transfer ATPase TrbB [Candidatus Anaerobiospirillum merdipullorum]|uniref:P-type conjugative transfer ATPase TrbB n=1 Tax=Candidatus Anaerobiospirillum merdipullorum TaxID=2838450 RepID=A0A9E2KND3_9GAMM|nr:P-type conjugative transfer ATPase TrbB [Candidatus Anaerobiospirillum merdipullorum]